MYVTLNCSLSACQINFTMKQMVGKCFLLVILIHFFDYLFKSGDVGVDREAGGGTK